MKKVSGNSIIWSEMGSGLKEPSPTKKCSSSAVLTCMRYCYAIYTFLIG